MKPSNLSSRLYFQVETGDHQTASRESGILRNAGLSDLMFRRSGGEISIPDTKLSENEETIPGQIYCHISKAPGHSEYHFSGTEHFKRP